MAEFRRYEKDERVGPYRVVDPVGFAGTLPTAVIETGSNQGITVILTTKGRMV